MLDVSPKNVVYLSNIVSLDKLSEVFSGPVTYLWPKTKADLVNLTDSLKNYSRTYGQFDVYLKGEDKLNQFFIQDGPRISPIVLICRPFFDIVLDPSNPWPKLANHGYPSYNPDMTAIFIAHGPNIKSQNISDLFKPIQPFPNIDLYPFMTRLLNITGLPNNGSQNIVDAVYQSP